MPCVLADRDEPNCPKEWVSFLRFLRWYGKRLLPGPGGIRTSPGQLVVGGLPWAFRSLGVVSCKRSQRENSLRTLGCIRLRVRLGVACNWVCWQCLANVVLWVHFMHSTFPELCGPWAVWSFHLTPGVLDKVWIISVPKAGLSLDPMERGRPYLGIMSLSRALVTSHAHSVHVGRPQPIPSRGRLPQVNSYSPCRAWLQ